MSAQLPKPAFLPSPEPRSEHKTKTSSSLLPPTGARFLKKRRQPQNGKRCAQCHIRQETCRGKLEQMLWRADTRGRCGPRNGTQPSGSGFLQRQHWSPQQKDPQDAPRRSSLETHILVLFLLFLNLSTGGAHGLANAADFTSMAPRPTQCPPKGTLMPASHCAGQSSLQGRTQGTEVVTPPCSL